MSSDRPSKRPRTSKHSNGIDDDIPSAQHYQVSYAHRSVVTYTKYSSKHDMILTGSQDGIVKFWKRTSSSTSPPPMTGVGTKKTPGGDGTELSGQCMEFVKSYVAHTAPITSLVMSLPDGDLAASVGEDRIIKFYDVGGFDVTGMIRVHRDFQCGRAASFIGEEQNLLAVSSSPAATKKRSGGAGVIYVFSSISLSPTPIKEIKIHASPIISMEYNFKHHCMISVDQKGVIEYWNGSILSFSSPSNQEVNTGGIGGNSIVQEYDAIDDVGNEDIAKRYQEKVSNAAFTSLGESPSLERNGVKFTSKFDTDLYSILKKKVHVISLAMNPSGSHFAVYGSDRKIRLFEYSTGKSVVQYDERMKVYDAQVQKRQALGESSSSNGMDTIDYGNRAAREKEMSDTTIMNLKSDASYQECGNQSLSLQFDPSGRYLIVPTIIGVKVIEWSTNKCRKVIAKGDASTFRFLGGCMCLGEAKIDKQMHLARSAGVGTVSSVKGKDAEKKSDALYVTMAFNKRRFYVFSHFDPIINAEKTQDDKNQQEAAINRDILNEPPDAEDLLLNNMDGKNAEETKLGKEAILRTTMGDIHIRLFPEETPRTVENFCGHARSSYYDNVIFHRVIKGFMIQTGDPLGDGTGGESIWGGEFEDEFVREYVIEHLHCRQYLIHVIFTHRFFSLLV